MFYDLRPTVFFTGQGNSCEVSVQDNAPYGLEKPMPFSDITGTGSCYGVALKNFIEKFDDYLNDLVRFREKILNSKRAYSDVITVDCTGEPLKQEAGIT